VLDSGHNGPIPGWLGRPGQNHSNAYTRAQKERDEFIHLRISSSDKRDTNIAWPHNPVAGAQARPPPPTASPQQPLEHTMKAEASNHTA
jgi:hypothetical protein